MSKNEFHVGKPVQLTVVPPRQCVVRSGQTVHWWVESPDGVLVEPEKGTATAVLTQQGHLVFQIGFRPTTVGTFVVRMKIGRHQVWVSRTYRAVANPAASMLASLGFASRSPASYLPLSHNPPTLHDDSDPTTEEVAPAIHDIEPENESADSVRDNRQDSRFAASSVFYFLLFAVVVLAVAAVLLWWFG